MFNAAALPKSLNSLNWYAIAGFGGAVILAGLAAYAIVALAMCL